MMIYLAARYSRRDELRRYAADLIVAGHAVTSRWLFEDHELPVGSPPSGGLRFAMEDMEDVLSAEAVISFTEEPGQAGGRNRGGRHVEMGIALGRGLQAVVVGPRENVFHYLPGVIVYPDWASCLRRLTFEPEVVARRPRGAWGHGPR